MSPVSLRPPLRMLTLAYTPEALVVSVHLAPTLHLRGAFLAVRGTGHIVWECDVEPAETDGPTELRIPLAVVLTAFEAAWPAHEAESLAAVPDGPVRSILADLGLRIHSESDLREIRSGLHDYTGLSVHRTSSEASRPIPSPSGSLTPYLRESGNLSVAFGPRQPTPRIRGSITAVHRHDASWQLVGKVESQSFALTGGRLVLVPRRSGERIALPTTITSTPAPQDATGPRTLHFRATLDQAMLLGHFDRPEYIDASFEADLWGHAAPLDVRVTRLAPRARVITPTSVFSDGSHAGEFRAYRTFKAGALAFEYRPMDPAAVPTARSPWRSGKALRWKTRNRPVWLVGERPETAQDTGLAIYEHLRGAHPEIDARYVISADSPDLSHLDGDPGVVLFGSREHVESTLAARRILSSHHSDYLLPVRGPKFQRNVAARRIFLQHGIMGTKNMVANYGYSAPGFTADAFIVSSERERRMIEDDFGWPAKRVFVTGLSRHDRLFGSLAPAERRILVMPTWRDWLRTPEAVLESEFFQRWNDLLRSEEFRTFLERNDLVADLYLHANMQPHADLFDLSNVTVIRHGDIAIQDLLVRSMAVITDYTSAAIDFSFLDRPVVYYQFDRTRFLGRRPSHFDLDEELPGEIVATRAELLQALDAAAERDFDIHPDARRKSRALIAHRDTNARERIVEAATAAPGRRLDPPIVRDGIASARRVVKRVRRRRSVNVLLERTRGPLRTTLYRVARRLPRNGIAVFESNLGADRGDSPGSIHRAILERGLPVKTAWVVRRGGRAAEGSLALERLSWRYLWVMGRASAWVSNQNQPSWMRRPDDTFYLQTWHGTPLKRMLHDMDEVVGRDDGYVGRVDQMISEWSLLLSPSPWASERFRSAFRYTGDVLEVGYPRNDGLADGSTQVRAAAIRKRLGLARSKKVLLYAPTFRDDQRRGKQFTFALPINMAALQAAIGHDYEIVVRLHPIVRGKVRLPWGVHNAGAGFEMEDLLAAADVLVTDYSSVMFDYTVLGRPIVFFVPDLERYRDSLRGFYFDFESTAPGPLVRTTAELIGVLGDDEGLARSSAVALAAFRERFCPADDGRAGERVVDELLERGVLPPPR